MKKRVLISCMAVTSAFFGYGQAAGPRQQSPDSLSTSVSTQRAVLNQYCVGCHNQRAKTAGLMLDNLDLALVGENAEVWEKVVRKLRAGVMPPAGAQRRAGAWPRQGQSPTPGIGWPSAWSHGGFRC